MTDIPFDLVKALHEINIAIGMVQEKRNHELLAQSHNYTNTQDNLNQMENIRLEVMNHIMELSKKRHG